MFLIQLQTVTPASFLAKTQGQEPIGSPTYCRAESVLSAREPFEIRAFAEPARRLLPS